MAPSDRGRWALDRQALVLNATALLYAMVTSLLGSEIPAIVRELKLDYAQAGLLPACSAIGSIIGSLVGGMLTDRFHRTMVAAGSLVVLSASALGIVASTQFSALAACVLLLGASAVALITLASGAVGDLFPGRRASAVNMLNAFVGAGGVVTPLYASLLARGGGDWRFAYVGVALALLALLFVVLRVGVPSSGGTARVRGTPMVGLLKDRRTLMLVFAVLVVGGVEWSFANWAMVYLTDEGGMTAVNAQTILSGYWLGILGARLALSRLLRTIEPQRAVGLLLFAAALAGLALVVTSAPVLLAIGVPVFGFLLGGLNPSLIGMTMDHNPLSTGSATGLALFAAGIGSTAIPAMIGFVADAYGLSWGLALLPLLLAALLLPVSMGLARTVAPERVPERSVS